jgi:hypothetical protein
MAELRRSSEEKKDRALKIIVAPRRNRVHSLSCRQDGKADTAMGAYETWKRHGSEMESEDRAQGFAAGGTDLSDEELQGILGDRFAEDLANSEIRGDISYEDAIAALVDGYRRGE